MKKIICMLLLIFIFSTTAYARYGPIVDIKHNGEYIHSNAKGFMKNNVALVPVRYAAQALGITDIGWDGSTGKITLRSSGHELILYARKNTAYINGYQTTVSVCPEIIGGRTYVPIRFIAEAFGSNVSWEKDVYAANIQNALPLSSAKGKYSDEDVYWLSRIIEAESKGEPIEGKIAVGNVVINRKNSPLFPDTIYGVIYHKTSGGYQFTPVKNGSINNTPSKDSLIAAKHALNGTSIVGNCLFFSNPKTATSSWMAQNRTYYTTICNHAFYL